LNQSNSKEKNIITVNLTNEEKIVFSELGINPLIKLGKEYLTSNNFVLLKESNKETEKPLDNKKTKAKQIKKISKSREEKIQINIEANANSKDKSTSKTNENNEVLSTDQKDEIELTDELNNARKKRRRSSASIE
jgi:ribonuclease E